MIVAVFLQQARGPLPWVALALAGIAWPLSLQYSPLSLTLGTGTSVGLAYELAFVFGLVGALCADRALEGSSWLLARASHGVALLLRVAGVTVAAATLSFICILPMALVGAAVAPEKLLSLALTSAHMAAILNLLASWRFSASARSVGLLLSALVVPAYIPSGAATFSFPLRILDPLTAGVQLDPNSTALAFQIGSIFVLLLLSSASREMLSR